MKKLFSLFIIGAALAFTQAASAQAVAMTATNGLTLDTVTNAATKNLTTKVKENGSVSIVFVVTKISGTVGGTATFQGSNDGVNYGALASAYTITDASQTKVFEVDKGKYLHYRIAVTGTGTMSASIKATLLAKKDN